MKMQNCHVAIPTKYQSNLPTTYGSIKSNQHFKVSAEYTALEQRLQNNQLKSNYNQELSPMAFYQPMPL